jgi:uncharacterized integral membrane protein
VTHEPPDEADREAARLAPGGRPSPRQVVAGVILVVILVFGLVNLEDTTVDFVFGQVTTPVFFVVAVPALLGFLAGLIVERHRERQRRR